MIRTRTLLPIVAATLLAACDTGDGTRLMQPTSQTTLPPPDTSAVSSEPLADVADGGGLPLGGSIVDPIAAGSEEAFEAFTPWVEGAPIDERHTCDGNDASPPITWAGVPAGTSEIALSLVDEDELSNGRPFIHWVVAGLDPALGGVDEGTVPEGAVQGLNFFGEVGYTGPCPDPGDTHTYRLTVYAVGQQIEVVDSTPAAELLDLIETVSVDAVSSTGTAAH